MRRIVRFIRNVPHLFAKVTVGYCIAFASGASVYALRILSRTGNDPAALLGIILGFFGGELLLLCLKTVLSEKNSRGDPGGKEEEL